MKDERRNVSLVLPGGTPDREVRVSLEWAGFSSDDSKAQQCEYTFGLEAKNSLGRGTRNRTDSVVPNLRSWTQQTEAVARERNRV